MTFLEAGGGKRGEQPHGDDREALGSGMEQNADATLSLETFQKEPDTSIFSRRKIDKRRFGAQPRLYFPMMKTGEEKTSLELSSWKRNMFQTINVFVLARRSGSTRCPNQCQGPMKNICPGSSHSEALSNIYLSSLFPKSILC